MGFPDCTFSMTPAGFTTFAPPNCSPCEQLIDQPCAGNNGDFQGKQSTSQPAKTFVTFYQSLSPRLMSRAYSWSEDCFEWSQFQIKMAAMQISLNLPWSSSSVSSITSSLSSLYCLFTITVYVVITINKFATNSLKNHAEVEVCLLIKMKEENSKLRRI